MGLEARAEAEAHEMMRIADNSSPEEIQVDKLRTDVRKFLVGKWGSEFYGDGGAQGGNGITVVVERGVKAEVVGGVLRIGADVNKGDPAGHTAAVIEGEVV